MGSCFEQVCPAACPSSALEAVGIRVPAAFFLPGHSAIQNSAASISRLVRVVNLLSLSGLTAPTAADSIPSQPCCCSRKCSRRRRCA